MKSAIFAIILFILAAPLTWAQSKPVIKMGYFELAPHGLNDKSGSAIDYMKLIAEELNWDVRFTMTPLARMMLTDELDGVLYIGKNAEREKKFNYTRYPLLQMQGAIAVAKKSSLTKIKSAKDLLPLTIGIWKEGYRSEVMRTEGLKTEPYPGGAVSRRALQMIANGRLDSFYCPEDISLQYTIDKIKLNDQLKVLPLPEPTTGLYVAFSKRIPIKMIEEFDAAHAKVAKKIAYKDFIKPYLKIKK